MNTSSKVLISGLPVAVLIAVGIYLLFLTTESRSVLPSDMSITTTAEYFQNVYNRDTAPGVLQELKNRINFLWDNAPGEDATVLVQTPPPVGTRYSLTANSSAQNLQVGFLPYVLGRHDPVLPGIYINRYDLQNYNRFATDFPDFFQANMWVEITHTCGHLPQCTYPICDVYWGHISPGSGMFLNTGAKPLLAKNRFDAYHRVLTYELGDSDSAWRAMAAKLNEFHTSADILHQFRHDWKEIGQHLPLTFRDMRPRVHNGPQHRNGLIVVGILCCLISIVLLVYAGFGVSEKRWGTLLVLVTPFLFWLLWSTIGLKGYILDSGWYTPEMARLSLMVDMEQLVKLAAHSDTHPLANGMTMLRVFDNDMLCLAKQQKYTMVMLSSQPNQNCTWLPEFCNLQNFTTLEGICNIQSNFSQGMCSNFKFRTGPVTRVMDNLVPSADCMCCESPKMRCTGCIGHISMRMCNDDDLTDEDCLALLPPPLPCVSKK
jgi:hypothetical protein